MNPVIVVFPPAAGGNHLKNMLSNDLDQDLYKEIYKNHAYWAHAKVGHNFNCDDLIKKNITHGHFGEVMSNQDLVRSISDRLRLIILSPDSLIDREMLYSRRKKLNYSTFSQVGDYFDGEQVFLYESFMYHHYFDISMNNIMNISISEWFNPDIANVLDRIVQFLQVDLDKELCLELHRLWYQKNFL
jgi:hypothetical protein